jgi:hypothetical protein
VHTTLWLAEERRRWSHIFQPTKAFFSSLGTRVGFTFRFPAFVPLHFSRLPNWIAPAPAAVRRESPPDGKASECRKPRSEVDGLSGLFAERICAEGRQAPGPFGPR